MELGLKERVCVVTGASRGIGLETARMLCAEGARVLLVARNEERVVAAADECMAAGADADGAAESLACDVTEAGAAARIAASAADRFGPVDVLVNNAGSAKWRDLDDVPDEDWQAAWDLNVMAPLHLMRALAPGMSERGWGRIVNVASTAGKRPSAAMAEYSVAKAAELSLSRLYADRHAADGVLVNAVCPGPVKSELWMEEGGLLDQSQGARRPRQPRRGAGRRRVEAADRPARRGGGGRLGDRLPLLRAGLLRRRCRLERGRRHRAGDHLIELSEALLSPEEAAAMDAHGRTEAAVLVPMHGWPEAPGLVFTERRGDLRRHAGEISFPGGRRDPGEELLETALREAEEEIGLRREHVELAGALPPIGTFVTSYKVHPFVGLIEPGLAFTPNPEEVESVIVASLDELARGICDAAAGAPRRPDQDRDLRGRGRADLGSHRAHPRRAAG